MTWKFRIMYYVSHKRFLDYNKLHYKLYAYYISNFGYYLHFDICHALPQISFGHVSTFENRYLLTSKPWNWSACLTSCFVLSLLLSLNVFTSISVESLMLYIQFYMLNASCTYYLSYNLLKINLLLDVLQRFQWSQWV